MVNENTLSNIDQSCVSDPQVSLSKYFNLLDGSPCYYPAHIVGISLTMGMPKIADNSCDVFKKVQNQ